MALFDIFKNKKKPAKHAEVKLKKPEKAAEKLEALPPQKRASEIAFRVLRRPHITERATDLIKDNQYIFEVYLRAAKNDIKKAVQDLYGVNVLSVRIVNIPAKRVMMRRVEGWRQGCKKAIVRIKQGQKIEFLPR